MIASKKECTSPGGQNLRHVSATDTYSQLPGTPVRHFKLQLALTRSHLKPRNHLPTSTNLITPVNQSAPSVLRRSDKRRSISYCQPTKSSRQLTMISDDDLYRLAIFLGSIAMVLIVLYHFFEVNSSDSALAEKASAAKPVQQAPAVGKSSSVAKS
ncbi:putative Oligosaccaryltransferase-domain-containing protein [Seiridium cardinale]